MTVPVLPASTGTPPVPALPSHPSGEPMYTAIFSKKLLRWHRSLRRGACWVCYYLLAQVMQQLLMFPMQARMQVRPPGCRDSVKQVATVLSLSRMSYGKRRKCDEVHSPTKADLCTRESRRQYHSRELAKEEMPFPGQVGYKRRG